MADYRRFTKTDWYTWGGATKFNERQDPFIYERELNEGLVGLTIIADKTGISVYISDGENDEEDIYYYRDIDYTSIRAEGELKHLIEYLEKYTYAPDLTYELDHPTDESTKGFEIY